MFTYFTYVDLSWFRNCSGGGGGRARPAYPSPPYQWLRPWRFITCKLQEVCYFSPCICYGISFFVSFLWFVKNGKMWIIPHRFFFCIKLSLLLPWWKLFILHFTASIHIFSAMNTFRPSRYLTRDWHPLNFKPQYQKILILF